MLTDFARDHLFTIAWFGVMAFVWFGWSQEDPPARWRAALGTGSGLGLLIATTFGIGLYRAWSQPSALEGSYHWFGLLVLAEVLAAGIGAVVLWRRGQGRWIAWWVALIVALHFVPLALLLQDGSLAVLGLLQAGALLGGLVTLRGAEQPSSAVAGPLMGISLLAFAAVSVVVFVVRHGSPWGVVG